jgi:heme iron utilization protein
MNTSDAQNMITKLLSGQNLGVLATLGQEYPYQSIVAFSASPDQKQLLFATLRETNKYRNLKQQPHVSMFIDNRLNQEADFVDTIGMTVLGTARELNDAECGGYRTPFLQKHPRLEEFLSSPDCALFLIEVSVYYVVWNFSQVMEVRMA